MAIIVQVQKKGAHDHALLSKKKQAPLFGYQGSGRTRWQFFQRQT